MPPLRPTARHASRCNTMVCSPTAASFAAQWQARRKDTADLSPLRLTHWHSLNPDTLEARGRKEVSLTWPWSFQEEMHMSVGSRSSRGVSASKKEKKSGARSMSSCSRISATHVSTYSANVHTPEHTFLLQFYVNVSDAAAQTPERPTVLADWTMRALKG